MACLYVADLEEFLPVVEGCRATGYRVSGPTKGYWVISGTPDITINRRAIGLGPALWNTALAGGIAGELAFFDKDSLTITERVP